VGVGATFESNVGAGVEGGIMDGTCTLPPTLANKAETIDHTWLMALTVVLYGWWQCAPVGYTPAEAQARAREVFGNAESHGLEDELWAWLKRDGETTTGSPVEALAKAEGAIAEDYSGEGLIHVSRSGGTWLASNHVLYRSGTQLRTLAANTPVVVGDGYFNEDLVIASGPILIVRGPIEDLTEQVGSGIDRRVNTMTAVVERAYQVFVEQPQGVAFNAPAPTP
jgi:hypothetical protein